MADWLLVLLLILTIYRATRLVIEDTFPPIGVPRTWLINWWDPDDEWTARALRNKVPNEKWPRPHWGALGRSLRYLFTCPWCMSMWTGALIIWVTDTWYIPVPAPILVWAAASAITGLLAGVEEKLSS